MSQIIDQIIERKSPLILNCINSRLGYVEKALLGMLNETFGDEWEKSSYKLSRLEQVEEIMSEPDSQSMSFLMWEPQLEIKKCTVFVNNFKDGWITLMNKFSTDYGKEIATGAFSNDKDDFPFFKFGYRKKLIVRDVHVLRDNEEWQFYSKGMPLEFEEIANYQEKQISKRLNNSIVENYMKALGFDCTKEQFWKSDTDAVEYKFTLQ